MSEKIIKSLGWIFIAIGILLLVGTALSINSTRKLLREGVRTTGNVVDFVESRDDEGQTMYAPVFVFLDEQGIEYRVESNVSSSPPGYVNGQAVDVIYRAGNPQGAEIQSTFGLWGLAAILGFIGVFFIIFGLGANFITRKLAPSQIETIDVQFGSGGSQDDSF